MTHKFETNNNQMNAVSLCQQELLIEGFNKRAGRRDGDQCWRWPTVAASKEWRMELTVISKMLKRLEWKKKHIQIIWNKTDLWKSVPESIAERRFENNTGNKECVNENTIRYERLFEASPSVNLSVWISAHSIPLMPRVLSIARVAESNRYRLQPHI